MSETPLAERVPAPAEVPAPQHPEIAVWRAPTPDDIDAIHELYAAAGKQDHPDYTTPRQEIADTFSLPHIDHSRDTILGFDADGLLVVAAMAMPHPSREVAAKVYLVGAVRPTHRRRGIGTVAMARSYARALQILASVTAAVPGQIALYAEETNPDAAALAERLGMKTVRWFTTMVRDLSAPIPELPTPEGTVLEPYTPERAMDAMAARNDAFRDHWGSLPSVEPSWRTFVDGPFLRGDLSTLLTRDGRILAFCLASVNEDDWEMRGAPHTYIDLIGVVREGRGRGYAPVTIAHTLAAARDAGLAQAVLDVDTASPTGALGLYERLGFVATDREQVLVRDF